MTWNYTGNPSSSDKDEVRYLVGDTDTDDQHTSDEEINWALTKHSNTQLAAALVCRALAAKYSSWVNSRVGDVSENQTDMAKAYTDRAKELDPSGLTKATALVLPRFGGLSISEKETLSTDTDAVQPSFSRGMNDIPGGPGDGAVSGVDEEDWIR